MTNITYFFQICAFEKALYIYLKCLYNTYNVSLFHVFQKSIIYQYKGIQYSSKERETIFKRASNTNFDRYVYAIFVQSFNNLLLSYLKQFSPQD